MMTGKGFGFLLALGLAALFTACERRPEGVLSDEEMSSLLCDMHLADAYATLEGQKSNMGVNATDTAMLAIRQGVLQNHDVTEQQFTKTLDWYGHNLDKYDDMYAMVLERLQDEKGRVAKAMQDKSTEPTVDLAASGILHLGLDGKGDPYKTLQLKGADIPTGAKLVWSGKTYASTDPLQLFIAVDYLDGSTAYIMRSVVGEGRQQITLQTDTAKKPLRGYVYLGAPSKQAAFVDSVALRVTPFNESSYYEVHSARLYVPAK